MKKIVLMLGFVLGISTVSQCKDLLPTHQNTPGHQCDVLWQACEENHVECLNHLLTSGIDPNNENQVVDGLYPIHFATTVECLSVLLHAGAFIDQQDLVTGATPIHKAAEEGNMAVVQHLLMCGCNPNIKNSLGQTPLDVASTDAIKDLIFAHMQPAAMEDEDNEDATDQAAASALHPAPPHVQPVQSAFVPNESDEWSSDLEPSPVTFFPPPPMGTFENDEDDIDQW